MAVRARAKKAVKGNNRKINTEVTEATSVASPAFLYLDRNRLFSKRVLVGLGIILLIILAANKKHWFVPATLNGFPIVSPEVIARLYSDYRLPAVNELIDEKIIMGEAKGKNAVPSQDEVNARMSELEQQVGGAENLNNLLSQEGTSRASLARRLMLRLSLEKIYSSEATVSAEEIDDFVQSNKVQLVATGAAEQRTEAENIIRQNKLSQVINQKFGQLREKANVKIF